MRLKNSLLLLLTATIWGVAFVAQSAGMDYVGPFTFNCARCLIGALVLVPLIFFMDRGKKRQREIPVENKKVLLRPCAVSGQQLPAIRHPVHHGGQGRIYHGLLHCDRAASGAVFR